MSKNIQVDLEHSIQEILIESEKDTDFTLPDHYEERIRHHKKMLAYYRKELRNYEGK